MPKLEKHIEQAVCEWAEDHGYLALKFTAPSQRGWPDRLFISENGEHVWLEFKAPGSKPTMLQRERKRQLNIRSTICEIVDTVDAAKEVLRMYSSEQVE